MKLTLEIKPRGLFAMKRLIEDELNSTLSHIEKYDGIDEEDLDSWTKENIECYKVEADILDELQTAFIEALDKMTSPIE